MQLNYFLEKKAIVRDKKGRYKIDPKKWAQAVTSLANKWLTIEGTGDRKQAESMLKRYSRDTPELKRMRKRITHVQEVVPRQAMAA